MSLRKPAIYLSALQFIVIVAALIGWPSILMAQDEQVPKYDLFVGYQWLHPGSKAPVPFSNPLQTFQIPDMVHGVGASLTFNFDPHWGIEADVGHNWDHYVTTASVGPRLMFRIQDGAYFIHTLISYNRLGIDRLKPNNGIGAILGGGLDYKINRWASWRIFEADYVLAHHTYGEFFPSNSRVLDMQGVRLRTGLVLNAGIPQTVPVAASVSVKPSEVMVGEPLTATASASNFNPKHTLNYQWTSTCGKISGTGETASIDTNGAAGGSCTVTVQVTDPRARKNNQASASTNFNVKEPPKNPPTVSCSANPSSVQAGATVSITCTCSSPDNVPVSVSNFTASGGTISGSGSSASLNTTGASPGTITVNTSCSDQRGLSTPATTQVTIESPPPPPPVNPEVKRLEARLALHSVYFPTAQPTPKNPSGGLVKSQQDTLKGLAADFKKYLESKPEARLTLEGHADPRGSAEYNQALSERRVNRTKSYLVEQGVPEANIETKAFGAQQQLTADQVRQSLDSNPELTAGEKQRIQKNMRTIILASNRRVDVTLNAAGVEQQSVRQFPFNAEDALTLIGGREKPAAAKPVRKKKK